LHNDSASPVTQIKALDAHAPRAGSDEAKNHAGHRGLA
jgi:hypothetical protein